MAERAMCFGCTGVAQLERRTRIRRRHERVHATGSSPKARPATFFDTFVLLSNPQSTPAQVTVRYLLDTGETVTVPKTIGANARLTINIETEDDARLRDTCGVDGDCFRCADHRRALDVLARRREAMGRRPQQLRRGAAPTPAGASPKAASAARSTSTRSSCWRIRSRPPRR